MTCFWALALLPAEKRKICDIILAASAVGLSGYPLEGEIRCGNLPGMSTVAEIESAIEKLDPHEMEALRDWMTRQAEARSARMWSPEKLGAVGEQMVAEKDPVRAEALHKQIVAGFYGDADA